MTAKQLFRGIKDLYGEDVTVTEEGNTIRLIPGRSLVTLEISCEVENEKVATALLDTINAGHPLVRFTLSDGQLFLHTTMLAGGKPKRNDLTQLTNLALAQFNAVKALLRGVSDEQG